MTFNKIVRAAVRELSLNSPLNQRAEIKFPLRTSIASYLQFIHLNENNDALSLMCNSTSCFELTKRSNTNI